MLEFQPNIGISTKFGDFNQISKYWPNFGNFYQLLEFLPNFGILTKFQNFNQFSRWNGPFCSGNLVLFFGRQKRRFAHMNGNFLDDDNDGCNDDNYGNFDDDKND